MKKSLTYICLVSLISLMGLTFTACNNGEAEYTIKPTPIKITVLTDKITAGTAQINLAPEDDRAYFFTRVVPANEYKPGTMDRDFMMLVMDSVYIDYLQWRYYHLREGETFIAPFTSHSLKYGVQTLHVDTLLPNTEYMVYAFCVNPITNQPMGDLYYDYFSTDSLPHVDLTFQFKLEGSSLYIMPSDDNTQYVSALESKDVLRDKYDDNPLVCIQNVVNTCKEYGILEYITHRNAYKEDLEYMMIPNEPYVYICAAYDGVIASKCTVCKLSEDSKGHFHILYE